MDLVAVVLLLLATATNPFVIDVMRHFTQVAFAEPQTERFVDAQLRQPPARRKNLVLIYLESFERTYFDDIQFPGLVTDLRQIEAGAQTFTNVGQSIGAGFTIGGMVAGQCGVPLLLSGSENSMQVTNFLTGATCLGDLLKSAGYRTEYIGGSSLTFAGKGSFYQSHGFDQVSGLETLMPGLVDPTYLGPWGLQDDTLFSLASDKIGQLAAGPDPFALVMLTLDTHHPDGHADTNRACRNVIYGDGSNAMLTSVKCADRLSANFIRSIQTSPLAKDTVIVVVSDHLAMVNGATDQLQALPRSNLFFILQDGVPPAAIDRKASTLDIGATVMAALEMDVGQIGFGVNLLGPQPTLAEKQPDEILMTDLFAEYLMGFQALYARLWDYPKIKEGLYVNVEAKSFEIGPASFTFPALMQLDSEGGVLQVTIADSLAGRSLAADALDLPGEQSLLWLDACATLAPLANIALEGELCLLSGSLDAQNLSVMPLPASVLVPRDAIVTPTDAGPPAILASRQQMLRGLLVNQGFAPREVALGVTGYRGGDIVIQSASADHGASLVRLLTIDSLDSGMDVVLSRGINLVAIDAEGSPTLLAYVDSCESKKAPSPFKIAMEAATGAVAFAIVAHDSAVCDMGPGALQAVLAGLDLPGSLSIGWRQPYAALIVRGAAPREFLSDGQDRIYLRLRTKGGEASPGKPASAQPGAASLAAPPSAASAPSAAACIAPPPSTYDSPASARMSLDIAYFLATSPAELAGIRHGWWDVEPFGRWIGANRAELSLHLPPGDGLRLAITGVPFRQPELPFEVWAGGRKLGATTLTEGRSAEILLAGLAGDTDVKFELVFSDLPLICPAALNIARDARLLVALIQSIEVLGTPPNGAAQDTALPSESLQANAKAGEAGPCLPPPISAVTSPKEALALDEPNWVGARPAAFGFGAGWWPQEPFGRWIGASDAEFTVILPDAARGDVLEFSGDTFGGQPMRVDVRYQGRLIHSASFGRDAPLLVPLSGLSRGTPIVLTLRFPEAVPTCPAATGLSGDARTLTVMFEAVRLTGDTSTAAALLAPSRTVEAR